MVILHGCEGIYANISLKTSFKLYKDWIAFLNGKNIITILPDSFHSRGFTNCKGDRSDSTFPSEV